MDYILKVFGEIPLGSVIIFILAMIAIVTACIKLYKLVTKFHDESQARCKLLKDLTDKIDLLQTSQDEISSKVSELERKQGIILKKQAEIEAENNAQKVNDLRARLLNDYRFYTDSKKNPLLSWSQMEKDTFYLLFKDYEKLGGNDYMHTTVDPAMRLLSVVPMYDKNGLATLTQSRQNG